MSDATKWLEPHEEQLWRRWVEAGARLNAVISRDLRGSGLSEPEFAVLVHLTDTSRGLRLGELAEALQWERSRVSHQVTRMVRRGLIERCDVADDGRGALAVVTAGGRGAIEQAAPGHLRTVREHFVDRLSEADRADLARILGALEG